MKTKKIFVALIAILAVLSMVILTACQGEAPQNGKDGIDGKDGTNGIDGVGIVSIEKTSSEGLVDTYTITLSDGTTTTFTVSNGANGQDGANGEQGVQGESGAQGPQGEQGVQGEPGTDGKDGADGISITNALISSNGELMLVFSTGNTVNLGKVVGAKGDKGDKGDTGAAGADGKDGVDGKDGKDGVSIIGASINDKNELVLEFSNDKTVNLGNVKGDKGEQGIGINDIYFNNDGELIVELTNGEKINCGNVPACEHTYSAWETTVEADCHYRGVKTRTCTKCGHEDNEIIEPGEHKYGEWTDFISNCTTKIQTRACTVCGNSQMKSETGDYHNYKASVIVPTCTESGYTLHSCNNCGKSYKDTYTEATGEHAWYDVYVVVSNCAERKVLKSCSVCNKTQIIEEEPNEEHNYVDRVCIFCGEKQPSEGLKYTLSDDKNYYTVSGTGTCKDTEIVIPKKYNGLPVTSIGGSAFSSCYRLTEIVIPDSVTSIGYEAFYTCDSLTEIVIPDSVTSIGEGAFFDCDSLTEIVIPDSVTSIGSKAFCGCDSLTSITVDESNTKYKSINGNLYTKDGKTLIQYAIGKTDTKFEIPDSVTSIGDRAFSSCDSLTEIVIPDSVTSIGNYAFRDCDSLTEIVIPDSVTSIGKYAFYYCNSLTEIVIPDSVTYIGEYTFEYCDSLTSITVDESNTKYKSINGNLYTKDGKTLIQYAIGKTDTKFEIPDSVTSIGSSAFADCDSLTSVTIGNSVTSIDSYAFSACDSLTIYCEATSKPSGWDADWNYDDCPVVWDCKSNDIADDGYIYTVINGVRYALKDGKATVAEQPRNIVSAVIQSSITYKGTSYTVTSIGFYAFRDCDSLTEIVIPDSVTRISDYAFYSCDSLTEIVIPNSVTSIGNYAFCYCDSLTEIVIPNSVTSIGAYAFSNCDRLTIYCEATSKPSGWSSSWNSSRPVVWGHVHSYTDGECVCGLKQN